MTRLLDCTLLSAMARMLKGCVSKMTFVALFGSLPHLALAQGGPPLLTDDPGTPGNGRTELNLAVTAEKFRTEAQYNTPLLDFNYGIGDRMQVKLEIPWLISTTTSHPTESGLGEIIGGFKWRYLDENRSGVDASVYPQVNYTAS